MLDETNLFREEALLMSHDPKAPVLILVFWLLGAAVISHSVSSTQKHAAATEEQREEQINDMLEKIGKGTSSFSVDIDALPVSGEEEMPVEDEVSSDSVSDDSSSDRPKSDPSEYTSYGDPSSTLTASGTIRIPSIACELPLWEGAGAIELRYGAGRLPLSAVPGEKGNLVIFGHRMKRYGSIFNRLDEVKIGDSICVTRNDLSFVYTVDRIETVDPSLLSYYISLGNEEGSEERRITLVTCTPTGVGSHRLLIIGHLSED